MCQWHGGEVVVVRGKATCRGGKGGVSVRGRGGCRGAKGSQQEGRIHEGEARGVVLQEEELVGVAEDSARAGN